MEEALNISKKGAEEQGLLLAKLPGGFGVFNKDLARREDLPSFKYKKCKCGKMDCYTIWESKEKEWVELCETCLNKIWPLDEKLNEQIQSKGI